MRTFTLRRPSDERVRALIEQQRTNALTYPDAGFTARAPADAPDLRRKAREIDAPFERVRDALRNWTQYDLPWIEVAAPRPPIVEGEVVANIVWVYGLWSVNCCRILAVEDGPDRFAYSIGTLPHHVETGEERFAVERRGTGSLLTIRSRSGPNHPLVRLFWGLGERAVQRFLREGTERIAREVS